MWEGRAGRGGVGWGGGGPAALSVGQLVSLCTAVSLCNWGGGGVSLNQPIVGAGFYSPVHEFLIE